MNRMMKRINGNAQDGFTLIELLIVIVVLGILSGIAILAVDQFRTDAETACKDANTRIDSTITAAEGASGSNYTKSDPDCDDDASTAE